MLIGLTAIKEWLSAAAVCLCRHLRVSILFTLVKSLAAPLFTCIFALGGATIGAITGAMKGQTTETGLCRGFGVGAVAGAITGVQLMDLIANGEPFSKVALICSLVNGKIFMEWVSPAVLKAYQWQVSTMETSLREISDIFEVTTTIRGLSTDAINELPVHKFDNTTGTCAICLQDFKGGECTRLLPSCRHIFHLHCIDEWLSRQGTCPVCRKDLQ